MNPGLLNKRLSFSFGAIWGSRAIKNKRRDNEQNKESYDFIIRKRTDVKEYHRFSCENISYMVLTVEEYQKEKGYLLLRCEKAKIHTFYDSCTVSRYVEVEMEYGETKESFSPIYTSVPCELIRLVSGSSSQSDQQNEIVQRFELFLENSYILKVGDKIEITHKLDTYNVIVISFFRTHTHQIVEIELEGEA